MPEKWLYLSEIHAVVDVMLIAEALLQGHFLHPNLMLK